MTALIITAACVTGVLVYAVGWWLTAAMVSYFAAKSPTYGMWDAMDYPISEGPNAGMFWPFVGVFLILRLIFYVPFKSMAGRDTSINPRTVGKKLAKR